MKKAPLESRLIKKTLIALRSRGAWAVKIHGGPFQEQGIPDILCCYRGKFLAFEAKRDESEELSPYQQYQVKRIRQAGGVAHRILTVADALHVLDEIDLRDARGNSSQS